jgi:hypothetical protein
MVSGVSVAFSKRRISSGQNYENPGKTMEITAKLPIHTADFPTEPNRVRLRKHHKSALGLTASFPNRLELP